MVSEPQSRSSMLLEEIVVKILIGERDSMPTYLVKLNIQATQKRLMSKVKILQSLLKK